MENYCIPLFERDRCVSLCVCYHFQTLSLPAGRQEAVKSTLAKYIHAKCPVFHIQRQEGRIENGQRMRALGQL